MATLNITTHILANIGGEDKEAGSLTVPDTLTVTDEVYDVRATVADNYGTETLWTSGTGGLTSPVYIYCETDADVFIELRNDKGTPEYFLVFLPANKSILMPTGLFGGGTTALIDGADLVAATDYGTVDQIRVQRDVPASTGSANVRLVVF